MNKLHSMKERNKMMRNERIALLFFIVLSLVTYTAHIIYGIFSDSVFALESYM